MSISARNHLKGKITDVKLGDVMAHITIKVGQNVIESVITRQSAEEMGLRKGDMVTSRRAECRAGEPGIWINNIGGRSPGHPVCFEAELLERLLLR